jgi:transposase
MGLTGVMEVPAADREVLERWLRARSIRAGLAQRARIVLLAGEGVGTNRIAERVGAAKQTVITWKQRYAAEGVAGLDDRPKPGRPQQIDEVAIVLATLEAPPERLGVTHWSSRLLGAEVGLSNVTVAKVWKKWKLQPWRAETFKFSTDPELEAKVRDVVGLYLHPPEKAVVLCVDGMRPPTTATKASPPTNPSRGLPMPPPPAASTSASPGAAMTTPSMWSPTT